MRTFRAQTLNSVAAGLAIACALAASPGLAQQGAVSADLPTFSIPRADLEAGVTNTVLAVLAGFGFYVGLVTLSSQTALIGLQLLNAIFIGIAERTPNIRVS